MWVCSFGNRNALSRDSQRHDFLFLSKITCSLVLFCVWFRRHLAELFCVRLTKKCDSCLISFFFPCIEKRLWSNRAARLKHLLELKTFALLFTFVRFLHRHELSEQKLVIDLDIFVYIILYYLLCFFKFGLKLKPQEDKRGNNREEWKPPADT